MRSVGFHRSNPRLFCALSRIRTYDRLLKRELLYQLSYERNIKDYTTNLDFLKVRCYDNLLMSIIDGVKIAKEVLAELQVRISSKQLDLGLAAITIGSDPALKKFVDLKKKAAEELGIKFLSYALDEGACEEDILAKVAELSQDPSIQGILIELPIPAHFNTQKLLDGIHPAKDVDVLSTISEELFYTGKGRIIPPAVLALKIVLEKHHIYLKDKKVEVFGQGRLIGKPISYWLESQGVEVIRIDENTSDPEILSREADIIVTGVGKPDLITLGMVKDGAVVVDFGYGRKDNKMVGDVAFSEVSEKASLITPVPGGMGPVVVAAVLSNLIQLATEGV